MSAAEPRPLDTLVRHAWQVLCTDALQVRAAAAEIAHRSDGDPAGQGYAAMFDARGRLSEGDRAGCEESLQCAEVAFGETGDLDGNAACLDLRAFLLARDGRFDAALATLAPALERLGALRSAVVRYFVLKRQAGLFELQGRFDDALRAHYVAVAAAREADLPAALANALAALGGFQASVLNHADALPLCQEAWGLCESTEWFGMTGSVAPNLMMALSGNGQHEAAAALADRLVALEPRLVPYQRDKRLFLYAIAYARAQRDEAAQDCLDRGLAERGSAAPARAEWAWTQAGLWNRQGRPDQALALVQRYLDGGAQAVNGPDFPVDLAQLYHEAAIASEALGDLRSALDCERLAAAAREKAQARASHARRLSLQINMALDAAHRQRDDALSGQQRLAALNAALNSANEAKSRFLAAASHDLRQPVHALALQAAALRQVLTTPRQFDMLAGIERCAGSLSGLFDALLDLSRMDAGALQPNRQQVDLGVLLLNLVEEEGPFAQAKGLRLALRVVGGGSRAACSDPALLEAMLRNLIVNAIKYTARGTVLVCARPWQRATAAPQWRLQIWDTGLGIAPEDAEQVFDEFYQVGNPARQRAHGLGLGLAIVQRLARLLDHPLSLRSVPGRGSCFELRLPAVDDAATGVTRAALPVALTGMHVAVIEDDPDVGAAMVTLLQLWGCSVTLAERADDIVAALAARAVGDATPDAVLADLRLPGPRNGAEEVARLRQCLHRDVPALILTGDVAAHTVQLLEGQQLPWLPKPAPVAQLAAWLAAVYTGP